MIAAGSLRVFLAVSLAAASLCPGAWASAWTLDPSATRIEFSVRNLSVARVDGTFRLASGHVTLDDEDPSRSTIGAVIDAASVDTSEPKRDAHLRSADFLDVARYPTIVSIDPNRTGRRRRPLEGHGRLDVARQDTPGAARRRQLNVRGDPFERPRHDHHRPSGLRHDVRRLRGG